MVNDRNGVVIATGTDYVVVGECRAIVGNSATIVAGATPITCDGADIEQATAARTPLAHVLATNTALGGEHTISGTSAGQLLTATSSSAAKFMVPDSTVNIESAKGHMDTMTAQCNFVGAPGGSYFLDVDGLNSGVFTVAIRRACKLGNVSITNTCTVAPGGATQDWRLLLTVNGGYPAYTTYTWQALPTIDTESGAWDTGHGTTFAAGDLVSVSIYDAFTAGDPTDGWVRVDFELITT